MRINIALLLAAGVSVAVIGLIAAVSSQRDDQRRPVAQPSVSTQEQYDAMRDLERSKAAAAKLAINKEIDMKVNYWAKRGCPSCTSQKERIDVVTSIVVDELGAEGKTYPGSLMVVYNSIDKAEAAGMFR
jgi:hypothetical protein